MHGNEKIDRIIREKLQHLRENPPDFVWDNIAKNTIQSDTNDTINKTDRAIKNKLNELTKDPPAYVWTHIRYYLELLSIWQNIKRVLLWQRVKRTIKAFLIAITTFLIFEYPLNKYDALKAPFTPTTKIQSAQTERNTATFKEPTKYQQYPNSKLAQTNILQENKKASSKGEKDLIAQTSSISSSYLDNQPPYQSYHNTQPITSLANNLISTEQNAKDDTDQLFYLPPLNPQLSKPDTPSNLTLSNRLSHTYEENTTIPLWQVDIGTQFSIMVNQYLFQSLFNNEFIAINPGLISSLYFGRIIPTGKYIYRVGMVYGGFDSKTAILIDGRWQKETIESRYIGISASIGKLLLTTGYRRWVDGWINTSLIYFMYHIYSSEILRTNPSSNTLGILISGELNYVKGLNNGDMFLIGGRINALPVGMFKQKGSGKFINLELHIGMRL